MTAALSGIMQPEPRTFATPRGGRAVAWAVAAGYWWGALVNEDLIPGLIRDIEATKGRQSVHEAECALRYQRIEENTGAMKNDLGAMKTSLESLATQGRRIAWSHNWKAWVVAAAIGSGLLGGLTWTTAQLYALEPLRVVAATKK